MTVHHIGGTPNLIVSPVENEVIMNEYIDEDLETLARRYQAIIDQDPEYWAQYSIDAEERRKAYYESIGGVPDSTLEELDDILREFNESR